MQGQASSEQDGGYGALDILNASQECTWILRLDGTIEHANHLARAMFTARPEDAASWRGIWPEESRFSLDRAVDIARAGQVAHFRAFLGDGRRRAYCDTTISPMRGRAGGVIRLLACARDVTDQVETLGFLKTVIQLLPSPLTVKNAEDGRYVLINRAAEDAFGLVAEEAVGRTAPEVLPVAIARTLTGVESRVLRTGEMQVWEEQVGPDAAPRYLLTRTLATYDDIGARHLITLGDDVTASRLAKATLRAALDQAEQASQAKSAFLANMSHEIRTPLNGIVAGADLLARGELSPRARELVEIIVNSGRSLERLLSDILDLVRIEARQVAIDNQPFDLGDLARSVSALCALRAEEKGVRLDARIDPAAERAVVGDSARLRQVLTNLMSNAVKFTDHGQVRLDVAPEADGRVRFSVRDTGIGFDAAEKGRIFERFQQADASFTRRFGGTGLGLAISRELVELMGGVLCCDSTPGEGSTFWFTLPLPLHRAASAKATAEAAPDAPDMPRVLVADDHPTNRKIVELMLAEVAEIFTAEDGREAVDLCAAIAPNLILMDMQMPVMDGLDAVREIRAREAATGAARTPIIMLTANARPEHVRASRQAGADLHLEKPITSAMLFSAIGRAFEAAQGAPEILAARA
ncbi:PAS domain-containing sensor histidine kinase [Caulobacter sp. UNC279MFTsu5.1]|uniref:hybrid sensor histidine kinase/response regulator n=1 Tax=Caulobacter sp. UNC279MFTsu5.1 TaxID=1502775 RepID=UPI0008E59B99|nr:PAS domain-containing sensor histidine kinase [Caulobacter sp. UNC279MFTsu5.1]SFK63242.1 Signal transduction histidine kinase [Caulobacter sp. UNC279MFTsu5.1]